MLCYKRKRLIREKKGRAIFIVHILSSFNCSFKVANVCSISYNRCGIFRRKAKFPISYRNQVCNWGGYIFES